MYDLGAGQQFADNLQRWMTIDSGDAQLTALNIRASIRSSGMRKPNRPSDIELAECTLQFLEPI